jgi:hypothetical protein
MKASLKLVNDRLYIQNIVYTFSRPWLGLYNPVLARYLAKHVVDMEKGSRRHFVIMDEVWSVEQGDSIHVTDVHRARQGE